MIASCCRTESCLMCGGSMWVLLLLICTSFIRGLVLSVGAGWWLPGQSQKGSSVQIRLNHTRAASGTLSDIFSCLLDRAGRNAVSRTRPLSWAPPPPLHFLPSTEKTHSDLNIHQCITQRDAGVRITSICRFWGFMILSDSVSWWIFNNAWCQNMADVTRPVHPEDVHLWNPPNPRCVTQLCLSH